MSEFPAGWIHAGLGELADFTNGKAFKKQEWRSSGTPIIRIQNLTTLSAAFNYADNSHEPKYRVRHDDLLVSWSASLGVYYWRGEDAWLNQHIFKVSNLRACDKRYLKYAIQVSISDFYAKAHGMGIVHITKRNFENHQIPLPPLNEQKRIAQKLDALLSQVDTLKARIDAIPAILKKFRLSVVSAASSGNMCGMNNSKAWRNACFGDVILSMSNGIGGPQNKSGKGLPVSRIETIANEYVDFKRIGFIEGVSAQDSLRYKLNHGDILFSHINSPAHLGKTAVFDNGDLFHGINLMRIIVDKALVLPEFFDYACKAHRAKGNFSQQAQHAVNQASLNQKKISEFDISFPPIDEQVEIVRRVKQLLLLADQLETRVSAAQKRVDSLTQSLLAKAFRGELVPQDPNDEPASALLERIRTQRAAAPKPRRGRKAATS